MGDKLSHLAPLITTMSYNTYFVGQGPVLLKLWQVVSCLTKMTMQNCHMPLANGSVAFIATGLSSNGSAAFKWKLHCNWLNTLRPRQNGRHFADDTFKRIFLNENVRSSIWISLKFVPKGPINNIPALIQIMAWRRPGDKPLSEPMVVSLPTHICVARPQWVKGSWQCHIYHIGLAFI